MEAALRKGNQHRNGSNWKKKASALHRTKKKVPDLLSDGEGRGGGEHCQTFSREKGTCQLILLREGKKKNFSETNKSSSNRD